MVRTGYRRDGGRARFDNDLEVGLRMFSALWLQRSGAAGRRRNARLHARRPKVAHGPFLRGTAVCLPLLFLLLSLSATAHAQTFLACGRPPTTSGTDSMGTAGLLAESWVNDGREILHAFAGDDLAAYFGFQPRLHVVQRAIPNAFAVQPDSIVISTGLLDLLNSTSEFAFVIAHELGHLVLAGREAVHPLAPLDAALEDAVAHEIVADAYALDLLESRGFDPGAGPALLAKIGSVAAQSGISVNHVFPSIPARLTAMTDGRTPRPARGG